MRSSLIRGLFVVSVASLWTLAGCGPPQVDAEGVRADLRTPPSSLAGASTQLYAAPTGAGSACTLAAPCSLGGAQTAARALVAGASGDIVVNLRGGTYRMNQALRLGPGDSGHDGHRVVYQAHAGEHPVLNGAISVNGFQLFDAARQIWRASVPVGTQGRQLYVNGVRAERPHTQRNAMQLTPTTRGLATIDASTTARAWVKPGMEVAQDNAWKHMRCAISSIEATTDTTPLAGHTRPASGGTTLVIEPHCWANNNTAVIHPGYPFNGGGVPPMLDNVSTVENVFELLGQDGQKGQFYLDGAAGLLYYVPRSGETLASADVELPVVEALLDLSGTPGHLAPVNDSDASIVYSAGVGRYGGDGNRGRGDIGDDVHGTQSAAASVAFTFTGTGVDFLSEIHPDEGSFDVSIRNVRTGTLVRSQTASAAGPTLLAQQVVYSASGLPRDTYTLTIKKHAADSTWLVVDGFVVTPDELTPVHDVAIRGLGFAYAAWVSPSLNGYLDNQAGILWDATTHAPVRIPGAVRVHRGQRIEISGNSFAHLGGAGLEIVDGSQDSSAVGNRFDDVSGGAISVGEVDDYYLDDSLATGPARMTSAIDIRNNSVTNTGLDYHDTVAIWVGNSRRSTVAHNLVAHTSYTGISVGWGWGWTAPCNLQSAARPGEPCRRGSSYNGGNQIIGNRIYDVMRTLIDGGPIYTLGQQSVLGGITPTVSGNVVSAATSCFHMIYHDEGSSYWRTHHNIVYDTGCHWLGIWIPTAHDINAGGDGPNYSDNPQAASDDGTADTILPPVALTFGAWQSAANDIAAVAGLEPAYAALTPSTRTLNDSDAALRYSSDAASPQWAALDFRGFGDFNDDVHYATANGAAMLVSFVGTGIDVLGEKHDSQGMVEVFLDGVSQGMVDTSLPGGSARQTQVAIFSKHGLAAGAHTVRVVKRGGTYATIDGVRFDQAVSEVTATP